MTYPTFARPKPACSVASWFGSAVTRWASLICRSRGPFAPNLVAAVIYTESSGYPSVTSYTGAIGLMQLEPSTACWLGFCGNLYDPGYSIAAGVAALHYYTTTYGLYGGLEAYNCGGPYGGECSYYASLVLAREQGGSL